MARLLVIVGITGNQGSSVAGAFLNDPSWTIRGITRDLSKPESHALVSKGIEMVQGDSDNVESLKIAFRGADAIFGNTAFSSAFISPTDEDAANLKPNQSIRQWCYELELQQGKNIADAAATVDGLELFVWSTLSDAAKWSKGKFKGVFHFDSKAHVVDYINATYPKLAARMSTLQLGLFATNWKWGQAAVPWQKRSDGSLLLKIPGDGDIPIPIVVPSDTGIFVKALTSVPPGKNLLAFGSLLTWAEYVELWSKINGIPASFEHGTVEELDRLAPGGYGEEIGEMYAYAQEFGYWGGDPSVVYATDLGVPCSVATVEDYIRNEDWSELLSRPPS